jgi:adenosylcobinamide-GDP ribazoletransferase
MMGLAVAVLVALWPLALLPVMAGAVGVVAGLVVGAVPAWQAQRLIGGRTGDVLGAVEQMFEVGFLLAVAGILAA